MKTFEKILIMDAFSKSWGLQDSLKTAVEKDDKILLKGCIATLSERACISPKYIENNVQRIVNW